MQESKAGVRKSVQKVLLEKEGLAAPPSAADYLTVKARRFVCSKAAPRANWPAGDFLSSTGVTGRVRENKTQDATELQRSILHPITAPGTQFLTSHPGSPIEPKSEYLNLTFHGVETQNLPICQVITLHREPPALITWTSLASEGQGEHPLSHLVLTKLPLFLEVQLIIAITQRPQQRSWALAKHCVARPRPASRAARDRAVLPACETVMIPLGTSIYCCLHSPPRFLTRPWNTVKFSFQVIHSVSFEWTHCMKHLSNILPFSGNFYVHLPCS